MPCGVAAAVSYAVTAVLLCVTTTDVTSTAMRARPGQLDQLKTGQREPQHAPSNENSMGYDDASSLNIGVHMRC